MPPRAGANPRGQRGGSGPRGARGGGAGRGGPRGGGPGPQHFAAAAPAPSTAGVPAAHVQTVGVKRTGTGTAGRPIQLIVNAFPVSAPESIIYHYDAINPDTLPSRLNLVLIKTLQDDNPLFNPRVVYDGRKNIYSPRELPLGPTSSAQFNVSLSPESSSGRPPKVYTVKLTKVQTINPELLNLFVQGTQSQDNAVLTAIMASNVVTRMAVYDRVASPPVPGTPLFAHNARSTFTNQEVRRIGGGIELWRGFFQSIRPSIGRLIINIDIATGTMYRGGPLLELCLDFLRRPDGDPNILSPKRGLDEPRRRQLQRFLANVRVTAPAPDSGRAQKARPIKGLSNVGADEIRFAQRDGRQTTVARYFAETYRRQLKYPSILCVEIGKGAMFPIEVCIVPPGQIMQKQVPSDLTTSVLEFSTKKPDERLNSIRQGVQALEFGQSEYIRQFGMSINTAGGPIQINARVLQTPALIYNDRSKSRRVTPANGSWNMIDKLLYDPKIITRWVWVIYADERRFRQQQAQDAVRGFIEACQKGGMQVLETDPIIRYENAHGQIANQLRAAGQACASKAQSRGQRGGPDLIVCVLPDNSGDMYTAIKHFGDITMGVATQCLRAFKCGRANMQYWMNVILKVNVKLGGINVIPDPASSFLSEQPTCIMGADVMHPPPGAQGRPSFTALVASVDSNGAKYVPKTCVQTGTVEIIADLKEMVKFGLEKFMQYRQHVEKKGTGLATAPKRLIFYRDGVSEGQFSHVLERELPLIKEACQELGFTPQITLVVVGKRHHFRFIPQNPRDADRSGNCPAGTVVDTGITHPTEWDYYLQSHGGLLGTSRPSHYSVLYDDIGFNPNSIQSLSFALCHVYARATRSVSIPAPVYYADILCARAKNHFAPGSVDMSDTATVLSAEAAQSLETYKRNFRPLHANQEKLMYFS